MATKAYQLGLDLLASCFLYEPAHWLGSLCDVHRSFQLLPPQELIQQLGELQFDYL